MPFGVESLIDLLLVFGYDYGSDVLLAGLRSFLYKCVWHLKSINENTDRVAKLAATNLYPFQCSLKVWEKDVLRTGLDFYSPQGGIKEIKAKKKAFRTSPEGHAGRWFILFC